MEKYKILEHPADLKIKAFGQNFEEVFSNLLLIKDAIDQGCTKIDFLEGSNHWKESWHLSTEWQYMFEK